MLCMTRSRIATIGVAALLSTSSASLIAEDVKPGLSSTWDGQTTLKDADVQIKIRGKIQANLFGYDVDKKYLTDKTYATKGAAGFKDGLGMEDAEIQFEGTAYKHVTFRMRYDVENSAKLNPSGGSAVASDKNYVKVDKWWIGLTALPYIGEITMREVDEHMGFIESETWIEETVTHNAMAGNGFPTMVGLMWKKKVANTGIELLDDRLDIWVAAGMINNEIGATDKDWSVNASVCWQPVKMDNNTNFYVKLDGAQVNNNGNNYTVTSSMYASKVSNPTLLTFTAKADAVTTICPAIAATYGMFGINAQYYMMDGSKPKNATTTDKDWSVSGWTVAAAVALTGENEARNLGIKKPKKSLDKEDGYGALELVARISMLDTGDDLGAPATTMAAAAAKGGEVTEYQVGVNWYPTGNMLVGLMYSMDNFKMNYTGAKDYRASMLGLRTMVKF